MSPLNFLYKLILKAMIRKDLLVPLILVKQEIIIECLPMSMRNEDMANQVYVSLRTNCYPNRLWTKWHLLSPKTSGRTVEGTSPSSVLCGS